MLALLVVMQAAGTAAGAAPLAQAEQAAPPAPAPPPPGYAPQPPPPGYAPQPPPPGYAPQPPQAGPPPYGGYPYYYYPYPHPPYPPPATRPPAPPPAPTPPEPEPEVNWFARIHVGLGPPGFSEETELLKLEGYGGAKLWASLDGGYLFHPNIGVGAWMALSHWSSAPFDEAPALEETAYFVGGELPIKLGSRGISAVIAPRLGFCSGDISFGGDVPAQSALTYGIDLSVTSFKYHLTGSVGLLRAAVDPPGELGRDHDFGGLYVVIGGTIDG